MSTIEPLNPSATAFSAARVASGDHLRIYTITTASNGWAGLEQFIRQCRVTGKLVPSGPDDYAVLDVLDANDNIVQDYGVPNARAWRWVKSKLKLNLAVDPTTGTALEAS